MNHPTPDDIFALRTKLGISQAAAAALVHAAPITWTQWERPTDAPTHRRMNLAAWELFTIKAERMLAERSKQPQVRRTR